MVDLWETTTTKKLYSSLTGFPALELKLQLFPPQVSYDSPRDSESQLNWNSVSLYYP